MSGKLFNRFYKKYQILIILLIFLGLTGIYFYPIFKGLIILPLDLLIGFYSPWYSPATILLKNPYMVDSITQLYPWKHLVYQSLTRGIIPLWNPYQLLGMPFMASLKPMVFYPLNVLFLLGETTGWNALLFCQVFLSMFFAYLLAREFKLSTLVSIFVGIAFSINSYMIALLEFGSDAQTLIWCPLYFLFVKKYIDKHDGKNLLFLGIALCFSIFGSQLQYLGYSLLVLLGFIFFYGISRRTNLKTYIFIFSSIFLGFGLSAIQLIPTFEMFFQSNRFLLDPTQAQNVFTQGLMPLNGLLRLLSPDFFGNPVTRDLGIGYIETSGYFGIIPLFFSLFAFYYFRKIFLVKFFTVVFIASILLSLQGIGQVLYWFRIPFVSNGSANRIFTLVMFSGSVLSGFGLYYFMAEKNIRKKVINLIAFISIFFLIILIAKIIKFNPSNINYSLIRNIKFSAIILSVFTAVSLVYFYISTKFKITKLSVLYILFVLSLTFFDLFRFGYRYLTYSNTKFLYPEVGVTKFLKSKISTNLTRVYGLSEPELSTYLNTYAIDTYNPFYPSRTAIMIDALQNKNITRSTSENKYYLTAKGDNLRNAIDFLGASLFVTARDENPSILHYSTGKYSGDFTRIYTDDKYDVYTNSSAYPRFKIYYNYRKTNSDAETLKILAGKSVDFRNTLLLEENLPIKLNEGTGSAELIKNDLNSLEFKINTDSPGLFYLSDTYFLGWYATVNNKETKIYRTNYNVRSVLVPAGVSVVKFTYDPMSYKVGKIVSLVSLLVLIILSKFVFSSSDSS